MGTGRKYQKKPMTRPKKSACKRTRRQRVQRTRLIALGIAEDKVATMNSREIRDMLKYPAKIKAKS